MPIVPAYGPVDGRNYATFYRAGLPEVPAGIVHGKIACVPEVAKFIPTPVSPFTRRRHSAD